MLFALARYGNARWGPAAVAGVGFLAWWVGRGLLGGVSAGEVTRMVTTRRKRAAVWLLLLVSAVGAGFVLEAERTAGGAFQVRPLVRAEIHAPVAAFLREIPLDEGERVSPNGFVARLEIPDLASRLAQKRTEVDEAVAKLSQSRIELVTAREEFARAGRLVALSAVSQAEYRAALHKLEVTTAEEEQSKARLARAREEAKFLEGQSAKLVVRCPVAGVVMTPHLREKQGQYFHEGDLICVVEEPAELVAEVKLPEQDVEHVRAGQRVELKARALPFETFAGVVERTAPAATAAAAGEAQSSVVVYCRFQGGHDGLRSGMTGQARVLCGKQPVIRVLGERALRFLRTEFWW
jgi:HlyD family secretion protein